MHGVLQLMLHVCQKEVFTGFEITLHEVLFNSVRGVSLVVGKVQEPLEVKVHIARQEGLSVGVYLSHIANIKSVGLFKRNNPRLLNK